jgi:hypothetical protein
MSSLEAVRPDVITAEPLTLPMTTVFSVSESGDGKAVAHALDFDLVSVAASPNEALRKLRIAVKYHVEYGLKFGFHRDILLKAPDEYWKPILGGKFSIGEPIVIDHRLLYPMTPEVPAAALHENRTPTRTAVAA